jgi:hypothetical protein
VLAKSFVCSDNKWNKASRSCDAPEDKYEEEDNEVVAGAGVVQTEQLIMAADADVPKATTVVHNEQKSEKEAPRKKEHREVTVDRRREALPKKERQKLEPAEAFAPIDEKLFIIGARFDVQRKGKSKYCEGIVIDVDREHRSVKFHFPNLDHEHDERIDMESSRIASLYSKTKIPEKRKISHPKEDKKRKRTESPEAEEGVECRSSVIDSNNTVSWRSENTIPKKPLALRALLQPVVATTSATSFPSICPTKLPSTASSAPEIEVSIPKKAPPMVATIPRKPKPPGSVPPSRTPVAASDVGGVIPRKQPPKPSPPQPAAAFTSSPDLDGSIPRKHSHTSRVPLPGVAAASTSGLDSTIPRKQSQSSRAPPLVAAAASNSDLDCAIPRKHIQASKAPEPAPPVAAAPSLSLECVIPRKKALPNGNSSMLAQIPTRQQPDDALSIKNIQKKKMRADGSPERPRSNSGTPEKHRKRRAEDFPHNERHGSNVGNPEKYWRPHETTRHDSGRRPDPPVAGPVLVQSPASAVARGRNDVRCEVTGLDALRHPKKSEPVQSTSSSLCSEEGEIAEDPISVRAKNSPGSARHSSQQRHPLQAQQVPVYQGYSSMASSTLESHKQLQRMNEINAHINAEMQWQMQTAMHQAITEELQRQQAFSAYATMAQLHNGSSSSHYYASRYERDEYQRDHRYEYDRDPYSGYERDDRYSRDSRDRERYGGYGNDRYYDRSYDNRDRYYRR